MSGCVGSSAICLWCFGRNQKKYSAAPTRLATTKTPEIVPPTIAPTLTLLVADSGAAVGVVVDVVDVVGAEVESEIVVRGEQRSTLKYVQVEL